MRSGQFRSVMLRPLLLAAVLAGFAGVGQAGVFDDDIARAQNAKTQKELTEFRAQTTASLERLESALKTQIDLANQIEALRGEVAKLRGQLEVLTHSDETGEKRQRDFYLDLDGRVRKFEGALTELQAKAAVPVAPAVPKIDPATETRHYEEALNLFKAKRYKDAQFAFQMFLRDYPAGTLAPSAQFWLGNTYYAQQDCQSAIDTHQGVVSQHPDSNKAPDAMLAIATCQQEMKDSKAARKTLEKLVATYAKSQAADTARQKLKRK